MEEFVIKDGKKLRLGYTTGSCATAASKASAYMLLSGQIKEHISLITPKGIELNLNVLDIQRGDDWVSCAIEKDSGDDPDVTRGSLVYGKVSLTSGSQINIDGGIGVGRVTKKGLDQPVGQAAINSVPRKMIKENIEEVCKLFDYNEGLNVEISIPAGVELAKKTFNPRLGIVGGISVLGTTGIVEPMSEKALVDTIRVELTQRKANGTEYVLLTPGNYGSEFIKMGLDINPSIAVQSSNFISDTLTMCQEMGFKGALFVGHIGKFVKVAGGVTNTHSKYGDCRMEIMAAHAGAVGVKPEKIQEILTCVTCDDAIRILDEEGKREETLNRIVEKIHFHLNYRREPMEVGSIIFSKEYGLLGKTENADRIFNIIKEENK